MFRSDGAITSSLILSDPPDRTTSGCYVYQVDTSVGRGAGILLGFAGGSTIRIEGTTLTWTTDAFVTSALTSSTTATQDGNG